MTAAAASGPAAAPRDLRRRNILLGLALAALYVALVVTFFIIFTTKGLPKDPSELRREQAHDQATRAAGSSEQKAP